ncbi:alanine racemase [Marinobacter salexigens]|uniref:Alanine racemase n=1 Tax=Marinobacter salexigens TaxID=1925763 RepID=A0ABS6AAR8_9GAMM|nr:alanine racemase [Marinobacter salexigens]MBU2874854.1 alanine racemase [Marinobacter salexigens]
MSRPAVAEIKLDSIRANFQLARSLAPNGKTIAVVKADAYGHGAAEVARYLADDVEVFAVACIEEALALRAAGLRHPILLLEGFFEADELDVISREGLWTAIHSQTQLDALARSSIPHPLPVWLKVDTGMHRLGFSPEQATKAYGDLSRMRQVSAVTVMTHLANADNDETQGITVANQISRLPSSLLKPEIELSLANSAGILAHKVARKHWQRPGIMLYGASPLAKENQYSEALRPSMTLKSRIIATKWVAPGDSVGYGGRFVAERSIRIGTVAMGYADGYPRQAIDGVPVLVNGKRTRLIGRVSMDMLTVDLTDIPEAGPDSEVEFWGDNLLANEVASYCDTIAYHLFTGVTKRVPRKYVG